MGVIVTWHRWPGFIAPHTRHPALNWQSGNLKFGHFNRRSVRDQQRTPCGASRFASTPLSAEIALWMFSSFDARQLRSFSSSFGYNRVL
jgi:hypothetical protein